MDNRLVGVDAYEFEKKLYHIAQHVELPPAPRVGPGHSALPQDQQLPPLLIINIQLPLYPVGFSCACWACSTLHHTIAAKITA